MYNKLERLQLKGFKSISEMDLELKHLNVLIGANGVGKSNFISFFRFMNKLVQKDLQFFVAQQGGADRFLHFGSQVTNAIEMHLLFGATDRYACTLVPDQTGKLIFKEEYCDRQEFASAGDKESGLHATSSHVAAYLSDWQVYHFHDTSDTAKIKQSGSIHDNERLRPQAENLAAFLFSIQDTAQYQRIVQTIQRVAPLILFLNQKKTIQIISDYGGNTVAPMIISMLMFFLMAPCDLSV
jgi:predicted ATPase